MDHTLAFQDRFSPALAPGWRWVHEDATAWRIAGGQLHLLTQPGTLWGPRNDAHNILVRPAPARTAATEVTVTNAPEGRGEQAGLIWYQSDGDYVKLVKEALEGGVFIVLAREEGEESKAVAHIPVTVPTVRLRLSLVEGKMVGQFQLPDSQEWQAAGECDPVDKPGLHVGLFTHGGVAGTERWVQFAEFRVLASA